MELAERYIRALESGRYRRGDDSRFRSQQNKFSPIGVLLDTFDNERWHNQYWSKTNKWGIPAIYCSRERRYTYYVSPFKEHKEWLYGGQWPMRLPIEEMQAQLPEQFEFANRTIYFNGMSLDECGLSFAEIASEMMEVLGCSQNDARNATRNSREQRKGSTKSTALIVPPMSAVGRESIAKPIGETSQTNTVGRVDEDRKIVKEIATRYEETAVTLTNGVETYRMDCVHKFIKCSTLAGDVRHLTKCEPITVLEREAVCDNPYSRAGVYKERTVDNCFDLVFGG